MKPSIAIWQFSLHAYCSTREWHKTCGWHITHLLFYHAKFIWRINNFSSSENRL